jgi:tRNA G46 methylase TrmB
MNDTFLDQVHRALVPGGQLSVMTDQEPFFMDMLATVEADPRFEKMHPERYLIGFEDGIKSRYQKIWESRGLTTLRFLLQKPIAPAEADELLPELAQIADGSRRDAENAEFYVFRR